MSTNISEHISFLEATKSQTGTRLGIKNEPNPDQLEAMKLLAEKVFEPLRKSVNRTIFISSFFRCEELNKKIGGAKGSQHSKGEAMDLDLDDFNAELFSHIKNHLDFDQLIWEFGDTKFPDWVHVSYSKNGNRKEVLRAIKSNGKTKYIKFDL